MRLYGLNLISTGVVAYQKMSPAVKHADNKPNPNNSFKPTPLLGAA